MKLFGNLFAGLFGGGADEENSWDTEDALKLELEQAWDQVQKMAREQVARREKQLRTEEADENLKQTEHEKFQSELWESILDLHRNLETGLNEDIVPRLRTLALGHSFGHREPVEESLEERIDHFVLRELFFRCAERAWDRLVFLMNKCDVVWPQPPDLSYRRPPESVAEFAEKRLEELQLEFSRTPLDKQADLAVGEIKVWAHTYPEKDSWLWRQTSLCGVGAGLHLQLFVTALELWLWRSDRLEQALRRQIEKELVEAKKLLSQGVVTLEDAERVAARSRQVSSEVIPALVWGFLEKRLSWDESLPQLSTVSKEVSIVDPVCEMGLTSDRIVSRYSYSGKTYYFCSEGCRRRFEAQPEKFTETST